MTTQPETTPDNLTASAGGSPAFAADTAGPYGSAGPEGRWNPEPPAQHFRMRRSASDKMLLGVCGGISEHTDIDPVYIRLGFLVSLFWGGIGIFAYIAAALVMPKPLPELR
ncbi:MAG: PspC domain-containing protein [Actinomycetota bacterium]|nr:PspC domain-containing protein [Actinomycetota bacterium]